MNADHISIKSIFFIVFVIVMNVVILFPAQALDIRVKEMAEVIDDTVLLGDIAKFNPEDDIRVDQLRKIEVASAPSPGANYRLSEQLLTYKIVPHISNMHDINLQVPANLHVKRSAQEINSQYLENIFKDYVKTNIPFPDKELVFERISAQNNILLPKGKLTYEIQSRSSSDFIGNVALTIDFYVNGRHVRKVPLTGRTSIKRKIVMAGVGIDSGQIITASDLFLTYETGTRIRKNAIVNIADAVGKRAIRSIRPGQPVLANMIEFPPLVKKGGRVLIKAENEEIRITALGKVLEDGRSGDLVRVINVNSGKEISATVTGPGIVEVFF